MYDKMLVFDYNYATKSESHISRAHVIDAMTFII